MWLTGSGAYAPQQTNQHLALLYPHQIRNYPVQQTTSSPCKPPSAFTPIKIPLIQYWTRLLWPLSLGPVNLARERSLITLT